MADVTALLDVSGVKLGLGSSSANAVATAAAVFAAAGADIASPDVRAQIMASALEGHRAVAPHGSGADVAASTFGGVLSFVTQTGVSGAPEIDLEEVNLPPGFHARVVWTGQAVRTSEFVAAVRALSSAHPEVHAAQVDAIGDASERMVTAMASAKAGDFIAAVADHHVAMEALGLAASVPIVEERLARVAALAAAHGGAAKPSGAGGGDVAMGFFASAQQADAFASAAAAEGLAPVALGLGADGVREEDVEP